MNNPDAANVSPPVSVVISTRNRSEGLPLTLKSLLANDYPDFEIWLVDQNRDDRVEKVVAPFRDNPRFNYLRSTSVGASAGRNLAAEHSRGQLILVTDDDCEVPVDWMSMVARLFQTDRRIGMVYGSVIAANYNQDKGHVPEFILESSKTLHNPREFNPLNGPAGCMALTREAWQTIGGFDKSIGPGSTITAGSDTDIVIRTLLAGYHIFESKEWKVLHYGFRDWAEFRGLVKRDWFGLGGVTAKYLKLGSWTIVISLVKMWFDIAIGGLLKSIFKEHRLSNGLAVISYLQGLWKGVRLGVDRGNRHFRCKV